MYTAAVALMIDVLFDIDSGSGRWFALPIGKGTDLHCLDKIAAKQTQQELKIDLFYHRCCYRI